MTPAAPTMHGDGAARCLVAVWVAGQLFGIPVEDVRDVLAPQPMTRIPLAPAEVAGAFNLRGRVVTAIDLRRRLRVDPAPAEARRMSVVVERQGELYGLLVDGVGDVLSPHAGLYEHNPPTLDHAWRGVSAGIYRLEKALLVVLDVARAIDLEPGRAA